ncbi:MAG: hypothetical protein ABSC47_02440 [Terracidiphilus sp.]|jgi:hypothetical protein
MKSFTALLVAVALVCPAFAQNVALQQKAALQEIQKRLKGPVVSPAFKPILLHTGKPITQNDKAQLVASAVKMYAATMPAQKPWQKSNIKATDTEPTVTQAIITPSQMFQGDLVIAEASMPIFVSPGTNSLKFVPDETSALDIFFAAKPNMSYILTFKVNSQSPNPQFRVGGNGSLEISNGSAGSNEFAIALVSNITGTIDVNLFSHNAYWNFESCEITGTPIN